MYIESASFFFSSKYPSRVFHLSDILIDLNDRHKTLYFCYYVCIFDIYSGTMNNGT